jgi:lysophospholipase L1-like esterase
VDFEEYLAFGDSSSGDLYPALDAGATTVAVALERRPAAGVVAPLGAASLLYRNDDARWPEFAGRDLVTASPGITFRSFVEDGATIGDVFGEQLATAQAGDARTLMTLTVGASELMSLLARRAPAAVTHQAATDIADAYEFQVDALRKLRPNSTLVLATVCDPSDGTALLPGVSTATQPVRIEALSMVNERIRTLAAGTPGTLLADLHTRFLGHGVSAEAKDRWYWRRSPLDPNARGASEVRRAWLDALEAGQG